MRKMD